MRKSRVFWIAGVVAAGASSVRAAPNIGDRAPALSAGAWLNLPGGLSSLSAKDLKGRIVMVEFFATWCGPCRASISHLIDMQRQFQDKGIIVLALTDESKEKVSAFATQNRLPYIIGCNATATLDAYGIRGLPTMCVIDAEGKIAWRGQPGDAEAEVEKLMRQKPPGLTWRLGRLFGNGNRAATADGGRRFAAAGTEVESSRKCEGLLDKARTLVKTGKGPEAAFYYKRVINEYPATTYASAARVELGRL